MFITECTNVKIVSSQYKT